jgi:hypothetical protein
MAHESDAALERLEGLVGRWKTEGQTTGASGGDQIGAIDTYERLPRGRPGARRAASRALALCI